MPTQTIKLTKSEKAAEGTMTFLTSGGAPPDSPRVRLRWTNQTSFPLRGAKDE